MTCMPLPWLYSTSRSLLLYVVVVVLACTWIPFANYKWNCHCMLAYGMIREMYFLSFEWNELDRKYALVGMLVCACAYMGGAVCYLWYLTVCACVVRQF